MDLSAREGKSQHSCEPRFSHVCLRLYIFISSKRKDKQKCSQGRSQDFFWGGKIPGAERRFSSKHRKISEIAALRFDDNLYILFFTRLVSNLCFEENEYVDTGPVFGIRIREQIPDPGVTYFPDPKLCTGHT